MKHTKKIISSILGLILIVILTSCTSNLPTTDTVKENTPLRIHFIDVGQGDSTLIQLKDKTILIDAGPRSAATNVVQYLKKANVNKIDYLIATHPHEDHIGGMVEVIKNFEVKEFYAPKKTSTTKTFENMVKELQNKKLKINVAKAGISFNLDNGATLEMIAPNSTDYEDVNNYSAVVKLTYRSQSFLFMGDAEKLSEKEILKKGENLKSAIIKLGHHGSSTSSSKELLDAVSPTYAVISCGKDNDYGHPHKEIIAELKSRSINSYRTDQEGSIVFESDGTTITKK